MIRSIILLALVVATTGLSAQGRANRDRVQDNFGLSADAWCAQADRGNRGDRSSCDVREETVGAVQSLDIDTGGNGGITVHGVSGSTSRLRFRIVAHARSESDAQAMVKDVDVSTSGGRVRVRGPRSRDGEGWSVDVEVESPHELPLTLATSNGGISIADVSGRTRFETVNGGVSLTAVAGDVRGSTVNGGLSVRLDGQQWEGAGLDVETTNGGVKLVVPNGYNADLSAETTNGGLDFDFPITVQGRLNGINRRIRTTLGAGGPQLHVRTVNGGVSIATR